jgi:hypothetical protein
MLKISLKQLSWRMAVGFEPHYEESTQTRAKATKKAPKKLAKHPV